MKIFSSLLLLLFVGALFVRCKKNSDPAPAPTKTDFLTSSAWVHQSSGVDLNKDGTIDFPFTSANVPACALDNVLTFKKDNTATSDEGATKCSATDPQTSPFAWSFADNEASLNISGNVFAVLNGKFKILTLTNTAFSLSRDTVMSSQSVSIVVNLKH